jgi:membrane protein implicated in regulation of membrane protease activity
MEFITQAEPLLQALWYVAIFATTVFAGQMIIALAGGGNHHDLTDAFDAPHGEMDFQVFSFRNLINFLLGFAWTGVATYRFFDSKLPLIVLSLTVGAFMVWGMFKLMRLLSRLGEDPTQTAENAIGKTGQVYLTIPANRSGKGKVSVSLGGSVQEFDALTDGDALATGASVEVLEVLGGGILLVK